MSYRRIVRTLVALPDRRLLRDRRSLVSRLIRRIRVERTGQRCWRFDGAMSRSGYRSVLYGNIHEGHGSSRIWRVNRLVLVLVTAQTDILRDAGEPFIDWLNRARRFYADEEAAHDVCDDSECCNPFHLKWQTHRTNLRAQARRRRAHGRQT